MKNSLLPSLSTALAMAALFTAGTGCVTFAAAPVVSGVTASQRPGTKLVDITYSVSDADGDLQNIQVEVSGDAGLTYTIPATALSGHVGPGVAPGTGRAIVWNAGVDWNGQYVPLAKIRVTAFDGTTPVPPAGMAYIPAGTHQMGDNLDADTAAMPVHAVTLNAFFMDKSEVSKELWQAVQTWSVGFGYGIGGGGYKAAGHPVQGISWYDAVKWCNARSQKEGRTPVYYTDTAQTIVYKTGNVDVTNVQVKWTADGYRLPTEAEWEKAARGGSLGQRFPWGNTIAQTQANYYGATASYSYDSGPNGLNSIGSVGGTSPATSPVGSFAANAYGLYDMSGNVWEWCWDWYGGTYYSDPTANSNPHGPGTGTNRVLRGGAWGYGADNARCARRNNFGPSNAFNDFGVRCVRGL